MIRFLVAMGVTVLCQLAAAQGVYKCSSGGKLSYADRPCTEGRVTRLPPVPAGVDLPEANAVATRDARTLVEFEKLRSARAKEAGRVKAREKEAREQMREETRLQRQARMASSHRKTCDKLRLRRKWAEEDLARTQGKAQEAARRKARRQAEALAVECPA